MRKLLLIVTLTAIAPLYSEIQSKYYEEMQRNAPEKLRIRVEKVDDDCCWFFCDKYQTRVTAIIMRVNKSAAGLQIGNRVYFEYEIFKPRQGWVGPRPMPVLKKGEEYDFFGSKTDAHKDKGVILSPDARGYSFESLIGDL